MRKSIIISQILLIMYLLAIFKPILPIVDYYINYDYIAEQLCENRNKPILACNGKCYLADELAKTNPDNPNQKSNVPKVDIEKIPYSTIPSISFKILDVVYLVTNTLNYTSTSKASIFINSVFRPPKNLV